MAGRTYDEAKRNLRKYEQLTDAIENLSKFLSREQENRLYRHIQSLEVSFGVDTIDGISFDPLDDTQENFVNGLDTRKVYNALRPMIRGRLKELEAERDLITF